MFPEGIELDRWGYGRPLDEVHEERRSPAHIRRAERACPNAAISFTVEKTAGPVTSALALDVMSGGE